MVLVGHTCPHSMLLQSHRTVRTVRRKSVCVYIYIYIYIYIYKVRFIQYYVLFSRILNKYLASKECGALLCTPCRTVVGPTQETLWIVYCLCLLTMSLLPDGVHLTESSQYLSNSTNLVGVS